MEDPFRAARAKLRGVNKALCNENVATILICQLMRGGEDALELLYSRALARAAVQTSATVVAADLAPLVQLEAHVAPQSCAALDSLQLEDSLARLQEELRGALGTTLQPTRARAAWARPLARALAVAALHMPECLEVLQMLFGGVARHDARRVDSIVQRLEIAEASGSFDLLGAAELARALGTGLAALAGRVEALDMHPYEPEGARAGGFGRGPYEAPVPLV